MGAGPTRSGGASPLSRLPSLLTPGRPVQRDDREGATSSLSHRREEIQALTRKFQDLAATKKEEDPPEVTPEVRLRRAGAQL